MPSAASCIAETCKGCHGIPGYFNASPAYHVPKLGGQNADYLEVALQGYRRGTRGHATMQAQASSLSDQDIADVAAFFSTLEGAAETGRASASAADDRRRAHEGGDLRRLSRAGRGRGRAAVAESRGSARDVSRSKRSASTRAAAAWTSS